MIKLLADRVLLKIEETKIETKSGIVLPEMSQSKSQTAIVHSVGSGRILDNGETLPLEVKPGDKVIYSRFAGNEINVDGEVLLLVNEQDIICVL